MFLLELEFEFIGVLLENERKYTIYYQNTMLVL